VLTGLIPLLSVSTKQNIINAAGGLLTVRCEVSLPVETLEIVKVDLAAVQ